MFLEALKNEVKVHEIGDVLDAENKQDDLECEEEGNKEDPLFQHFDHGDHNEDEFLPSSGCRKKIDLKDDEHLPKEAQSLDRPQRKTLDIGLGFARDLVKARN